jgi:hypothetical protein
MAALADFGLIRFFLGIFIFLLVFVISYGFLSYRKVFGPGKEPLYGLISLALGVIAAVSPAISNLLAFLAPWFFLMVFLGFFALFILSVFGLNTEAMSLGSDKRLVTPVIIITVVILIFGLSTVFGQETLDARDTNDVANPGPGINQTLESIDAVNQGPQSTDTGDFGQNLLNTIIHPKVLGMIAFLLIASFAMFFLTGSP